MFEIKKNLVVGDTCVLSNFILLDRIDILQKVFTHIYIPKKVYSEIMNRENSEKQRNKITKLIQSGFIIIKVLDLKNKQKAIKMTTTDDHLHIGECEAICLVDKLGKNNYGILTDDKNALFYCDFEKYDVYSSLRIFIYAYSIGYLSRIEANELPYQMLEKGRRISQQHIHSYFEKLNEIDNLYYLCEKDMFNIIMHSKYSDRLKEIITCPELDFEF